MTKELYEARQEIKRLNELLDAFDKLPKAIQNPLIAEAKTLCLKALKLAMIKEQNAAIEARLDKAVV